MLTIEPEANGTYVLRAAGKLTRADYERFVPEFDRVVGTRKSVRLLIDLTDLEGWHLPALWEELKFDLEHWGQFSRMAIVGDKAWQEWAVRLSKPVLKATTRFFRPREIEQARAWLAEGGSSG